MKSIPERLSHERLMSKRIYHGHSSEEFSVDIDSGTWYYACLGVAALVALIVFTFFLHRRYNRVKGQNFSYCQFRWLLSCCGFVRDDDDAPDIRHPPSPTAEQAQQQPDAQTNTALHSTEVFNEIVTGHPIQTYSQYSPDAVAFETPPFASHAPSGYQEMVYVSPPTPPRTQKARGNPF